VWIIVVVVVLLIIAAVIGVFVLKKLKTNKKQRRRSSIPLAPVEAYNDAYLTNDKPKKAVELVSTGGAVS